MTSSTSTSSAPTSEPAGPPAQPTSAGVGTPVHPLDLQAGDRVLLPVTGPGEDEITWWGPVTVTGVVLVDSGLAQVRYAPQPGQDAWSAHVLLEGAAFRAGALRLEGPPA